MRSVVEVGYNGVYQADGLSVGYGDLVEGTHDLLAVFIAGHPCHAVFHNACDVSVDVFNEECGILLLGDELCKEYVRKISFLQDQIQEIFNRL